MKSAQDDAGDGFGLDGVFEQGAEGGMASCASGEAEEEPVEIALQVLGVQPVGRRRAPSASEESLS